MAKKPAQRTDWKGRAAGLESDLVELNRKLTKAENDRTYAKAQESIQTRNAAGYKSCLTMISQISIYKLQDCGGGIGGGSPEQKPREIIDDDEARHQLSRAITIAETGLRVGQPEQMGRGY